MGLGQKVKEAVGLGHHTGEHATTTGHHIGTGTEPLAGTTAYENVSATYGSTGTSGIAGPVVPGTAGAETAYTEGMEGRTGVVDVPVVQQTTTTTPGYVAQEGVREGVRPETCGAEYFVKTEDRPIVKERVEQVLEHRPVEKEFVVETRATGAERETGVGEVEHLGTTERVVGVTPPSAPCE